MRNNVTIKPHQTFLRISINATFWNGIADIIIKSLTSGPLLTAYVLSFGVGNIFLGLLQSVIPWSNLCNLPVAYYLEKNKSPKKIACYSSLFSRPLLLSAACSFLFINKSWGFMLFSASYILSFAIIGITAGAFWPWCKMLVPHSVSTSFFAHRIKYILLAKIITIATTTLAISYISNHYAEYTNYLYAIFFFIAFIAGCFYTYTLFQMSEVKLKVINNLSFLQKIRLCLANSSYKSFFCRIGFCNFSLAFFTSFSFAFLLNGLHLPIYLSFYLSMGSSFVDILCIDTWKKYTQKRSISDLLSLSSLYFCLAVIFFILLSFSNQYTYPLLIVGFILVGIGNAGINLGISDSIISFVPQIHSPIYISLLNMGRFFFYGFGAFLAGILLDILSFWTSEIYLWFFLICFILFFCTCIICRNIRPVN